MADLLLVSEPSGVANLRREGVIDGKIRLVGNVMIDTMLDSLPRARARDTATRLGLTPRAYGLVTLHRPSNVDDPHVLRRLLDVLRELSSSMPLVFPTHPRTKAVMVRHGFGVNGVIANSRLMFLEPQPYLDHISLMADASVVLTDSGGMQEETAVLGIPCLTLRENTERPVTIELGTSRLVGNDPRRVRAAFTEVLEGAWPLGGAIPLWDGRAGERVANELASWLGV
jgi:UDP-N-acetylglucosamine 2-epimerase (non-hydrolysing)